MSSEESFARQICRALDVGARDLAPSVTERLRAAHERALAAQPLRSADMQLVGGSEMALHAGEHGGGHPFRMLAAMLALLLGVAFAYYWNAFEQANENEVIDSALLADDLPPNAYLDRGFQAWLEKHLPAGE